MAKEFFKVLEIEQVLGLSGSFQPVAVEEILLAEAAGRVLAEDVSADSDLPGFSRSTVDGYAVRAASTFGAGESSPALFQVAGAVAMGETPKQPVAAGETVRIATGGMLPSGADSVVMLEHAEPLDDSSIEVFRSVAPGQNVIAAGEDFARGATVAVAGRRLRPQDTGVLAAFGRTRLRVYRRPVVGIISTGDEIVPADALPAPGQVRDVNSYTLGGLVAESGAVPLGYGIIADEFKALHAAAVRAVSQCDMVLVSGGSSVGARDFTIEVISAFPGAEILVHGIAISPGKPTILAQVDQKPFWGLPGHVVSAMIVFTRIVRPFLRRLAGARQLRGDELRVPARLTRNLPSAQGRTDFIRVRIVRREEGLWAEPILGKSGLLNTMVKADGIIEIGKNVEGLEEGSPVEVMLFKNQF